MPIKLFLGWKHTKLNSLHVRSLWSCTSYNLQSILVSHLPEWQKFYNRTESSHGLLKLSPLCHLKLSPLCHLIYSHVQACMFLNFILKSQKKHNKNILEAVQFLYCFSVSVIWRSCHRSLNYSDQANYKSSSSQNSSTYITLWQL